VRQGTLRGIAEVQLKSSSIWNSSGPHRFGYKIWASPPARPVLDSNGSVQPDPNGKVRYTAVIRFASHAFQRQWSEFVVRPVRDAHPDALADDWGDGP